MKNIHAKLLDAVEETLLMPASDPLDRLRRDMELENAVMLSCNFTQLFAMGVDVDVTEFEEGN